MMGCGRTTDYLFGESAGMRLREVLYYCSTVRYEGAKVQVEWWLHFCMLERSSNTPP